MQKIALVRYNPYGVSTWVALSKITGRFLCSEPRDSISADFFGGEYTDIIAPNRFRQKIRDFAADAVLRLGEQVSGEEYYEGQKLKVYLVEVRRGTRGPQMLISRTHPGLVKRLFELEVPEIFDGTVEIRSIAREAGSRTKMAVYSSDENVDPIGAHLRGFHHWLHLTTINLNGGRPFGVGNVEFAQGGLNILRRLRSDERYAHIPVIMATAKGTEFDKVIGLDLGAD